MPLPSRIPVRYSEEDAGYISVRPVVKQVFRLHELADMVVSIAGKDPVRVQQIFHSGTAVYNGYRYWWDSIAAEASEIETLLAPFPGMIPRARSSRPKPSPRFWKSAAGRNATSLKSAVRKHLQRNSCES